MLSLVDRPRSTDTYQEAQIAFQDFDGVHFNADTEEFIEVDQHGNEIRRVSARSSSGSLLDAANMLRSPPRPYSLFAPPPEENMVYYPAPVPRMLNLPKRLSQLPAANVQARRRTQLLNEGFPQQGQQAARQSVLWPAPSTLSDASASQRSGSGSASQPGAAAETTANNRRSMLNQRMSMANLPPQLRASVYFEHQSIPQEVEVKSESAVATLDSILDASARAPVNAFTDHPFAGDVRKSVYAPGDLAKRRSTVLLSSPEMKNRSRRKSSIGNLFKRQSTILDEEVERPSSRGSGNALNGLDVDENGNRIRKRRSVLSLGDELERVEEDGNTPATEIHDYGFPRRRSTLIDQAGHLDHDEDARSADGRQTPMYSMNEDHDLDDGEQIAEDFRDEEEREDIDDGDVVYAQPSTLLAELQVRKAQLKSRSRTAATAFPNGMHSTLLELDAVEEISKKNRRNRRIELAWEDPANRMQDAARANDDDDVPLGMLYPAKDGMYNRKVGDGRDFQRPLGLMERRELEDNEPLSSRRNRLRGVSPLRAQRRPVPVRSATQPIVQVENHDQDEAVSDGEEGETLGQRARRMKTKDALDTALSDVVPKNGERPLSTFTDDVLSQFGGLNVQENSDAAKTEDAADAAVDPTEETLGQRRARLQREREAAGATATPARPPLRSSSSLANLLSANPVGDRTLSSGKRVEPAQGSLLHANAQLQSKHKQDLYNQNFRSSSLMLRDGPLVDARSPSMSAGVGLLGQQASRPRNGAFAGGVYNQSGHAIPQQQMAMGGAFGAPSPAMSPMTMSSPMMHSSPFGPMMGGGGAYGMPTPPPMMGMGMAAALGPSMQPAQRNAIDQWRMGVNS